MRTARPLQSTAPAVLSTPMVLIPAELLGEVHAALADVRDLLESREQGGPSEVLTRTEAAKFFRCSLATIDRLCRDEGGLPYHLLGDSRRFIRRELLEWLSGRNGTPAFHEQANETHGDAR